MKAYTVHSNSEGEVWFTCISGSLHAAVLAGFGIVLLKGGLQFVKEISNFDRTLILCFLMYHSCMFNTFKACVIRTVLISLKKHWPTHLHTLFGRYGVL